MSTPCSRSSAWPSATQQNTKWAATIDKMVELDIFHRKYNMRKNRSYRLVNAETLCVLSERALVLVLSWELKLHQTSNKPSNSPICYSNWTSWIGFHCLTHEAPWLVLTLDCCPSFGTWHFQTQRPKRKVKVLTSLSWSHMFWLRSDASASQPSTVPLEQMCLLACLQIWLLLLHSGVSVKRARAAECKWTVNTSNYVLILCVWVKSSSKAKCGAVNQVCFIYISPSHSFCL